MRTTCFFVLLAMPAIAASAERWGPTWSEVTGNLYSTTQMNRVAATIKQVDGRHETKRIVKVEPGMHEVVVASPMRKGFSGSDAQVKLDIQPCKRYYVNAQFKSGGGTEWEPVLVMVESIAGCKLPKG